jgi:hypothetical protein
MTPIDWSQVGKFAFLRFRDIDREERLHGDITSGYSLQFAVRTFIVRLMSPGSEIRNREIHT